MFIQAIKEHTGEGNSALERLTYKHNEENNVKAIVDEETCIGCELCAQICPAVFQMEDNLAKVMTHPVPEDQQDSCREAEDSCPVDAISTEE